MPIKTILNVDDNAANRYLKSRTLRTAGFHVIDSATGKDALAHIAENRPDLVLLDINLPDMSGIEVCRLIKQNPSTHRIPVIHISATYLTAPDEARGVDAGAEIYLSEPVPPAVLISAVRTLLKLKAAENSLAAAAQRILLANESAGIATWETNLSTGATVWSPRFFEMLGYDSKSTDASQEALIARVQPEHRAQVAALLGDGVSGKEQFSSEYWILRADNAQARCLHLSGKLHVDHGEGPAHLIGIAMDVTERRRGEAERERLLGEARQGQEREARISEHLRSELATRDDFLAMLAHELRNPLAPIRNVAQVIKALSPEPSRLADLSAIIERQVTHLCRLVDDLLDTARISKGLVTLRKEYVDLGALVSRAVENADPVIQEYKHALTISLPAEQLFLHADPVRMTQVISNLLDNAARYTPGNGIISIHCERVRDEAVIRIKDSGLGMEPQLMSTIFELFTQGERSSDRSSGGLGLGLALVRRLVQLHGGQVDAASAGTGKGSEFTIRMPASGAAEPRVDGVKPAKAAPATRVLVIDDNVDAAESMSILLSAEGHTVETAYDGPSAIARSAVFDPQFVLVDIGLPGIDGYEVARRLRLSHPDAVIVALTGYAQSDDGEKAKASGFDGYRLKPIAPADLIALLNSCENARERNKGAPDARSMGAVHGGGRAPYP